MMPTTFRWALLAIISTAFISGCSSTAPSVTETTVPPSTDVVEYTTTEVLRSPGAVDLVERYAEDGFYYVVQREGIVTRHEYNTTESTVVLDIRSLTTTDNERGLLGITFRQNEQKQWHLYANHTDIDGNTRVVEYLTRADGTVDATTRRLLLTIQQPYANHNGGGVAIGPDNMLYIALGDGGSSNDPERRAQDLSSLLGKLLRIDPTPSSQSPYSIPSDNPFVNTPNARPEIWSLGLRNPWRFTFAANGDLWIADVGQNTWEEINHVRYTGLTAAGQGANFGWSGFEGNHQFNADQSVQNHVPPIFEYEHVDGQCSISGAAVSAATNMPKRPDRFFFGDYCSGNIRSISHDVEGRVSVEDVASDLGNVTAVRSTSRGIFVLTLDGPILQVRTS
jgi:glucose/arabinose dehydrogenase